MSKLTNPFRALDLDRPLAVLDLEATGTDTERDRIVSIAIVKYAPRYCERDWPDFGPTGDPVEFTTLVNPGVPIPEEATDVHGITDAAVESAPRFARVAHRVVSFLEGCDLAGFGLARFDLPLLAAEMKRVEVPFALGDRKVVDALKLFHRVDPRTLAAAVRRYLGVEHSEAHDARGDVLATAEVLEKILRTHVELPTDVKQLHRLLHEVDVQGKFKRQGGRIVIASGRHAGRTPEDVAATDRSFLLWLRRQPLLDDARAIVEAALAAVLDED